MPKLSSPISHWGLTLTLGLSLFCTSVPVGAESSTSQTVPAHLSWIDPEFQSIAPYMIASYTSLEQVDAFNKAFPAMNSFSEAQPTKLISTPNTDPLNGADQYEVEISLYYPQTPLPDAESPYADAAFYRATPLLDTDALPKLIYYIPGGGYLFRIAYYNSLRLQNLSNLLQAVVAVPRYRLAQEKPFPAALTDCYAGLDHLLKNSLKYDFDANNVYLMGESAGGGLAAAVSLYNRDRHKHKINAQILLYPMLDCYTGTEKGPRIPKQVGEVVWDAPSNVFAWNSYADPDLLRKEKPELMGYYSPSHATNLKGIPPSYICVGDLDLFASEDLRYADNLVLEGSKVEIHVGRGLFHLFDIAVPQARASQALMRSMSTFIYKNRTARH